MKNFNCLLSLLTLIIIFSSCEEYKPEEKTLRSIEGKVQKGPFISGSSVTIYELDQNLTPTGISFNTPIKDNQGSFSLSNIPLDTTFVKLKADGFYYNEISGKLSDAQITLYALADISGMQKVNVNLLTHLEYERAEYLFNRGSTLAEAKAQAQQEILAIFSIEQDTIISSEKMNIIERGDDNAVLLAITSILQGFRNEGEMTELLYGLINDIREDGLIDDQELGSALINQAVYLDTISISENLITRYKEEGYTPTLPDYPKFIDQFIALTEFNNDELIIKYPKTGLNGENILNLDLDTIYASHNRQEYFYSLCAVLPINTKLKVIINSINGSGWFYQPNTLFNWQISTFNWNNNSQIFTAIEPDVTTDVSMIFEPGTFKVEYYEMGDKEPSREKIFHAIIK